MAGPLVYGLETGIRVAGHASDLHTGDVMHIGILEVILTGIHSLQSVFTIVFDNLLFRISPSSTWLTGVSLVVCSAVYIVVSHACESRMQKFIECSKMANGGTSTSRGRGVKSSMGDIEDVQATELEQLSDGEHMERVRI